MQRSLLAYEKKIKNYNMDVIFKEMNKNKGEFNLNTKKIDFMIHEIKKNTAWSNARQMVSKWFRAGNIFTFLEVRST